MTRNANDVDFIERLKGYFWVIVIEIVLIGVIAWYLKG
jgi:hypothetical protein